MNKRAFHVYTLAAKQPRAPQHANIGVALNHFAKILVFGLALLILACLNKFILGTGQNFSAGQIMQQSSADIYFARMSSFAILLMSIVLANITGVSRTAIRTSALFWLPLILFLWLRLPILEGDGPVLLRTLNFYAVIIAMSLLACNKENSNLFLKYLYYIMAIANSIGLVLFTAKIPFSYFSDGYGMMFTGVFPQKDILSTTAALGAILAISRITSGYKCIDIGIFCLQIITLFCAATLSSLGAFIFGFFAIFRPVLLLGLTGAFAILLPFTHFFSHRLQPCWARILPLLAGQDFGSSLLRKPFSRRFLGTAFAMYRQRLTGCRCYRASFALTVSSFHTHIIFGLMLFINLAFLAPQF